MHQHTCFHSFQNKIRNECVNKTAKNRQNQSDRKWAENLRCTCSTQRVAIYDWNNARETYKTLHPRLSSSALSLYASPQSDRMFGNFVLARLYCTKITKPFIDFAWNWEWPRVRKPPFVCGNHGVSAPDGIFYCPDFIGSEMPRQTTPCCMRRAVSRNVRLEFQRTLYAPRVHRRVYMRTNAPR